MADCGNCGNKVFGLLGGVSYPGGSFCNDVCAMDWHRKHSVLHPLRGGLGAAVTKALSGEELLFNFETPNGESLAGGNETLAFVTYSLFTGSSVTRIPYGELKMISLRKGLFGVVPLKFTGTGSSFELLVKGGLTGTSLTEILGIIKNLKPDIELEGLAEVMEQAEREIKPVHVMRGLNDLLEVFEDQVCITPKGFWGFVNKGLKGTKTIPFKSITAIQHKAPGFTSGYLQFGILGGVESQGGLLAATSDENSFIFASDNAKAQEIKQFIERRIREMQSLEGPKSPESGIDVLDQIKKLSELRDAGILSEDEFVQKKTQLLSRL